MNDTEPQTAGGKVLWHFTMSLDGLVAGPNHEMDWMTGGRTDQAAAVPGEADGELVDVLWPVIEEGPQHAPGDRSQWNRRVG